MKDLLRLRTRKLTTTFVFVIVLSLTLAGIAYAFTVGSVEGIWSAIDTNGASCDTWASGPGDSPTNTWSSWNTQNPPTGDENQVRYGGRYDWRGNFQCDLSFGSQSGFGFDGSNGPVTPTAVEPFYLGKFTHYNNPINSTNSFLWVDLALTVPVTCPDSSTTSFTFTPRFNLEETPNSADPCAYPAGPNQNGCADKVTIVEPPSLQTFTCGGIDYQVNILGFTTEGLGGEACNLSYDSSAVSNVYLTAEQTDNVACLWAQIISAQVEVIKDFTATTPGVFDLWIQKDTDAAVRYATDVGDDGTTGKQPFDIAATTSFTVSETAGTASDLSNYWKTISCFDREDDSLIAATPAYYSLSSLTFDVNPGQDVYCIITNKDIPTAVTISNAVAVAGDGNVTVSWETAPFADTLGFIINRDGAAVSGLITSPDGASSYQFVDGNLKAGTYQYSIVEVGNEKEPLALDAVTVYSYLKLPVVIRK